MPSNQQQDQLFEKALFAVGKLVDKFEENCSYYLSPAYQEAEVRKDFIDKLFKALGWDVDHDTQPDPYRQEVKIEKSEKRAKGRADYCFSLAPHYTRTRFFVEAKRPSLAIDTPDSCFQAIRYSWPKGVPIAVLTDFHKIHILDSRFKPNINSSTSRIVETWHYLELKDRSRFSRLYWLLSRDAVSKGAIDNYADNELPAQQLAARQYSLFAAETREFDDDFLIKMDGWRESLAIAFRKTNMGITGEQLTECVQRTIDRLVFIRFLEDKDIEPDQIISRFGNNTRTHWQDFISTSRKLDQIYNGVVFKAHSIVDSPAFEPDGPVFAEICDELTDDHSPYNFDSIPVEILGRIYERFLGREVLTDERTVRVVEKEGVRKAGGVYYTPDYIVAYMVENTIGKRLKGKTPTEILSYRVIDTSCGSGSFLIGAFGYLIKIMTAYYSKRPSKAKKGEIEWRGDECHLSLSYKRELLLKCIHGVDIDPQAVEVAQLSLYLKLMEEETTHSANQQQLEIGIALLPSLTQNIVVGNSLVTLDEAAGDLFSIERLREMKSLDFKATFPRVFREGGFDLVIGNPPYIKEYTNREAFKHVYTSKYYQGKMDLWYLFACRGLDWLKSGTGTLAYIATSNWITSAGAKILRNKIAEQARIEQLIDFGAYMVFKEASVQTMILIAAKDSEPERYSFDYRRLRGDKPSLTDAQAILENAANQGCEYLRPEFERMRLRCSPFAFTDSVSHDLLEKIASQSNFQLNKDEITQGIIAPQVCVDKKSQAKLGSDFKAGQGIFLLSNEEKRMLKLKKEELDLLKPFYTSRQLGRYRGDPSNESWLIYTPSEFKDEKKMTSYPNLRAHLDRYQSIITSSNKPYGLHRARSERFFEGEKILALRKCIEPVFTYSDFSCYVSQSYNVIKTDRINLKYLTALMNSVAIRYWLTHKGKMQGHHYQVDGEPIMNIPIHVPSKARQEEIAKLVDRIIDLMTEATTCTTDAESEQMNRYIRNCDNKIQDAIAELYSLDESDRARLLSLDRTGL